jgi:hypothetical protein
MQIKIQKIKNNVFKTQKLEVYLTLYIIENPNPLCKPNPIC